MKRLFSTICSFSEESERIIKRARLLISSISSSSRETSSSNSENLDGDHSYELLDNSLITISDSDDDRSLSPELIDLTEDDPLSISSEESTSLDIEYCPICLELLSDLQSHNIHLCITPCDHVLCTNCSRQLLLRTSRCPLCRQNISSSTLMPYCILR